MARNALFRKRLSRIIHTMSGNTTPHQVTVFIHIPKCGGNSLLASLSSSRNFGTDEIFNINDHSGSEELFGTAEKYDVRLVELRGMPEKEKNTIRFVHGHMPYGIHRYFEKPVRYLGLLREPVERLESLYRFAKTNPRHYLHPIASRLSFADFVSSDESFELDNHQTRLLSGTFPKYCSPQLPYVTQADCDVAIENIRQPNNWFAPLSRLRDYLQLLAAQAQLDVGSVVTRNVTRIPRENLGDSTYEAVVKRNRFDDQLFKSVDAEFQHRHDAATSKEPIAPTLCRRLASLVFRQLGPKTV